MVLLLFSKQYNIPFTSIPFTITLIVFVLTLVALQLFLYTYQTKLFDPLEPLELTKDEEINLAIIGKQELKKYPWLIFSLLVIVIFILILQSYIKQADSTMNFLQEIFLGFITPILLIAPAPFFRLKLYNSIIRGEI